MPPDCGCVIHPGETHAEHMRELSIRMAKAKARTVQAGVERAVTKINTGERLTRRELHAVQHAVHALAHIRMDLHIQLDAIEGRADRLAAPNDKEGQ